MRNRSFKFLAWIMLVIMCASLCACERKAPEDEAELDYVAKLPDAERVVTPNQSDSAQSEDNTEKGGEFIVLRYKSKGAMVGKVQARLIELGYLHTEVTEYYGESTEKAVKAFQRASGIDITGETDAVTYEALMAEDAVVCALPLEGIVIGIDPGCQSHSDHEQEPIAPDSEITKNKASAGSVGSVTGEGEYNINMAVAVFLRDELKSLGASVVLTHESVDDNISNVERAKVFNDNKVNLAIVLHCNSVKDEKTKGAFVIIPANNADSEACRKAAESILAAFCKTTKAEKREVLVRDNQTVLNWCDRPIVCLFMGHLSNAEEDRLLTSADYQKKAAQGIADGIADYFCN